MIGPINT